MLEVPSSSLCPLNPQPLKTEYFPIIQGTYPFCQQGLCLVYLFFLVLRTWHYIGTQYEMNTWILPGVTSAPRLQQLPFIAFLSSNILRCVIAGALSQFPALYITLVLSAVSACSINICFIIEDWIGWGWGDNLAITFGLLPILAAANGKEAGAGRNLAQRCLSLQRTVNSSWCPELM